MDLQQLFSMFSSGGNQPMSNQSAAGQEQEPEQNMGALSQAGGQMSGINLLRQLLANHGGTGAMSFMHNKGGNSMAGPGGIPMSLQTLLANLRQGQPAMGASGMESTLRNAGPRKINPMHFGDINSILGGLGGSSM